MFPTDLRPRQSRSTVPGRKGEWKGQAEKDAWIAAWRLEHPLPPMTKKDRWRTENAAWVEMRREVRRMEKAAARKSAALGRNGHKQHD